MILMAILGVDSPSFNIDRCTLEFYALPMGINLYRFAIYFDLK